MVVAAEAEIASKSWQSFQHMHYQNVVHNAITLDNIMIGQGKGGASLYILPGQRFEVDFTASAEKKAAGLEINISPTLGPEPMDKAIHKPEPRDKALVFYYEESLAPELYRILWRQHCNIDPYLNHLATIQETVDVGQLTRSTSASKLQRQRSDKSRNSTEPRDDFSKLKKLEKSAFKNVAKKGRKMFKILLVSG